MGEPLGSIVIPAFNEEAVIGRTLVSLARGLDASTVETVVACNGCTDATADIARSSSLAPIVLELGPVGKSAAIRIAETKIHSMPRLYLDADVEMSGRAATDVLCALRRGAIAGRPPSEFVTDDSSWLVRRFYAARRELGVLQNDLSGAGIYGLSAMARSRFEEFPAIAADDLFAARIVTEGEVHIVDTEPVRIHAPRRARAQVRVLARVYRGNREFDATFPEFARTTTQRTSTALIALATRGRRPIDALVYAGFVVVGRLASVLRRAGWERDDTSRRQGATS